MVEIELSTPRGALTLVEACAAGIVATDIAVHPRVLTTSRRIFICYLILDFRRAAKRPSAV
ncbi:hypothetical protein BFN03_11955 [Rhodococcus sp. WMMA185]|nr:hypothetical protein BFN03_11955 [Rhodococcus sp. WMMA185]